MHSDATIVTHTRLTTITCMRTFCSVLPVGSRSRLRSYSADVRSRSLLLDFMYDTLHWKAHQEPKAAGLQDRL